jgi:hypothetical protein
MNIDQYESRCVPQQFINCVGRAEGRISASSNQVSPFAPEQFMASMGLYFP